MGIPVFKERVCFLMISFFPLRVDPFREGFVVQRSKWEVAILCFFAVISHELAR